MAEIRFAPESSRFHDCTAGLRAGIASGRAFRVKWRGMSQKEKTSVAVNGLREGQDYTERTGAGDEVRERREARMSKAVILYTLV